MERSARGRGWTRIERPHLILCEGVDAWKFIVAYLNSTALQYDPRFSNNVHVIDFGGNDELRRRLQLCTTLDGFDAIKSLLIIRDSETDPASAADSIRSALRSVGLAEPQQPHVWHRSDPAVGFLLFPSCDLEPLPGALEDLCANILLEDPRNARLVNDIDAFLNGLQTEHFKAAPRFKAAMHIFFSLHDRYVSLKLGEAADAGAFDWYSHALRPLRDFIAEAFEWYESSDDTSIF